MNKELEDLINAALIDGKISSKEKAILLRKAERLDITEEELEIFIEEKLKHIKEYSSEELSDEKTTIFVTSFFLGLIVYIAYCYTHNKEWYMYIPWSIAGMFLGLAFGLLLTGFVYIAKIKSIRNINPALGWGIVLSMIALNSYIIYPTNKITKNSESNNLPCANIDDCISKYDFVSARNYLSSFKYTELYDNTRKIVIAESNYWVNQGEYDKALSIIDETDAKQISQYGYDDGEQNKIKSKLLKAIINKLIDNKYFTKAKQYALKETDEKENKKLLKLISDSEKLCSKK